MAKAAAKRRADSIEARQNRYGYAFIMPWLIGLFAFTLIPMAFSLMLSFCKWDIVTGLSTIEFIGLKNYTKIFADKANAHVDASGRPPLCAVLYPLCFHGQRASAGAEGEHHCA